MKKVVLRSFFILFVTLIGTTLCAEDIYLRSGGYIEEPCMNRYFECDCLEIPFDESCVVECTTPCRKRCGLCGTFFVTADYLYWRAREDGLVYAVTGLPDLGNTENSPGGPPLLGSGSAQHLDFNCHSGFRFGGGYCVPCCCWDIYLNYTHFHADASGFSQAPPGVLWVEYGPPAGALLATDATAKWKLHFQTLDLEIGRSFCLGNCVSVRPFGGLEAVWTTDDYDLNYLSAPDDFLQIVEHRQKFRGIGPRLGINNTWKFFPCFRFFADGAIALVCGRYSVKRIDTVEDIVFVNTRDDFHIIRPILDFKIGVRWDTRICNCFGLFVKAAFENLLFLKHNQFMHFVNGSFFSMAGVNKGVYHNINGDLTFYGLTLSAGVCF